LYVETRGCGHEISCVSLILLLNGRLFQNCFSAVKKGAECEVEALTEAERAAIATAEVPDE
jgi:hypothetical protein